MSLCVEGHFHESVVSTNAETCNKSCNDYMRFRIKIDSQNSKRIHTIATFSFQLFIKFTRCGEVLYVVGNLVTPNEDWLAMLSVM